MAKDFSEVFPIKRFAYRIPGLETAMRDELRRFMIAKLFQPHSEPDLMAITREVARGKCRQQ
jgi:hypothetical protein